jgi:hypothetical protein
MRYDIDSLMHEDEKFVLLSDAAQALWTLLLTGPQRRRLPGLQYTTLAQLAGIRRRSPELVKEALHELVEAGMLKHDEKARVILLPNQPFYNQTPNGNIIRGWFTDWRGIPESPLKQEFVQLLLQAIDFKSPKGSSDRIQAWAETFGAIGTRPKKGVTPSQSPGGEPPQSGPVAEEGFPPSRVTVPPLKTPPLTLTQKTGNGSSRPPPNNSSQVPATSDEISSLLPSLGLGAEQQRLKGLGNPLDLDLDLDRSSMDSGSDLKSGSDPRGGAGGEGAGRIPCPVKLWDLMPEPTKASLDTSLIPRAAQEFLCKGFTARFAGRLEHERSFNEWVSSAVRAIQYDYHDPKKRPPVLPEKPKPLKFRKWDD